MLLLRGARALFLAAVLGLIEPPRVRRLPVGSSGFSPAGA